MRKSFVRLIICAICALTIALPATGCGDSSLGGISFPDPNLEAAIREAIDKPSGTIEQADLEGLTYLDASFKNIEDLTGIEYCSSLIELRLGYNKISDITPLSNLSSLNLLVLSGNAVTDISSISTLTVIDGLLLGNNQISDINPLSNLSSLTGLLLGNNQISDIAAISNLIHLEELGLENNQIIDISALQSLTNLYHLEISANQIIDIEPLVNNYGISSGDTIIIVGNPLNEASINEYIPELEARGVEVDY